MFRLRVIIPSLNETRIYNLINKLKNDYDLIVIDDGSKKKIKNYIKNCPRVTILRNKSTKGYEKSLLKGFKFSSSKYEYLLTMDADGEHPISNIKKIYNYAKKNKIDLVVGSRSRLNRFSEKILSFLFFKFFKLKDPLSGFKIYNTKILKKIISTKNIKNDFLVDLIKHFIKLNHRVSYININSSKSKRRKSKLPKIGTHLKILKLIKYLY